MLKTSRRAVDLVVAGSREEFRAFIGNEIAGLSRVIQDANIRLD